MVGLLFLIGCGPASDVDFSADIAADDRYPLGIYYGGTAPVESMRLPLKALRKAGGNLLVVGGDTTNGARLDSIRILAGKSGLRFLVTDRGALPFPPADDPATLVTSLLTGAPYTVVAGSAPSLLNAIRALRIVESRVDLPSSEPADNVTGNTSSGPARALVDAAGNYAIYLPGRGAVRLTLEDTTLTRRVTVVGYLGTQRSEILSPPYDRTMELTSAEERGGWLLITGE